MSGARTRPSQIDSTTPSKPSRPSGASNSSTAGPTPSLEPRVFQVAAFSDHSSTFWPPLSSYQQLSSLHLHGLRSNSNGERESTWASSSTLSTIWNPQRPWLRTKLMETDSPSCERSSGCWRQHQKHSKSEFGTIMLGNQI